MKTVNNVKPILFSTPMVIALNVLKRQTRRLLKNFNPDYPIFKGIGRKHKLNVPDPIATFAVFENEFGERIKIKSPYQVGDVMWVRETWSIAVHERFPVDYHGNPTCEESFIYKAVINEDGLNWKPSIHMPKDAARIFLKVTHVRLERLQDISENDAISEGIERMAKVHWWRNYLNDPLPGVSMARESFYTLWVSLYGSNSWKQNPWVWVFYFEVITKPENFNIQHNGKKL